MYSISICTQYIQCVFSLFITYYYFTTCDSLDKDVTTTKLQALDEKLAGAPKFTS